MRTAKYNNNTCARIIHACVLWVNDDWEVSAGERIVTGIIVILFISIVSFQRRVHFLRFLSSFTSSPDPPFSLSLSLTHSLYLSHSLSLGFSERRQNLNNNNNIETFPFGARKTIAAQQHDNNITASHIIYICIRVIIILRICLRNVTRVLIAAAYSLNTPRFSGRVILLKLLRVFQASCVC